MTNGRVCCIFGETLTHTEMRVLDLIRYICLHPVYTKIVFFNDDAEMMPMAAILLLASIDPSHYDTMFFRVIGTLEQDTLLVYY